MCPVSKVDCEIEMFVLFAVIFLIFPPLYLKFQPVGLIVVFRLMVSKFLLCHIVNALPPSKKKKSEAVARLLALINKLCTIWHCLW